MRNKTVAAILALFLGVFGIHRFYLGQIGRGILYMVFFWAVPIMFIISIVDMVSLFAMDQEDFDEKYNRKYYNLTRGHARAEYRRRGYRRNVNIDFDFDVNKVYDEPVPPVRNRRTEKRPDPRRTRRSRQKTKEQLAAQKASMYKKSGIEKYKDFEFEEAISDFEKAISINPNDRALYFNLACAYSLTEQKGKSLYNLSKAVELGFNDFEKIQSHDALAFIRIQSDYDDFVKNGYKIPTEVPLKKKIDHQTLDLLEQLQQLASLRERDLITEEEFAAQKKKLLG